MSVINFIDSSVDLVKFKLETSSSTEGIDENKLKEYSEILHNTLFGKVGSFSYEHLYALYVYSKKGVKINKEEYVNKLYTEWDKNKSNTIALLHLELIANLYDFAKKLKDAGDKPEEGMELPDIKHSILGIKVEVK